jgi:signal transduction histidine kinase
MSGILSSLLDVNRLEAGNLRPSKSNFAISEVFDSVTVDFLDLVAEKGLRWRVVRSELLVRSDRKLLDAMLRNLLSNAIRYTDRGPFCWAAGARVTRSASRSGTAASASRKVSWLLYFRSTTRPRRVPERGASDWVWLSSDA